MSSSPFQSFKDYILYLYIHIAYADGIVQDSEEVLIKYKIKGLFPEDDMNEKYEEAIKLYKADAGKHETIIDAGHTQFVDVEFYKKYKVFRDLYNIISADGIVDAKETEALEKLKKIIGLEANQMGF